MRDPIPRDLEGRIALARSIAAGDEEAERNNELVLPGTARADLLQAADDLEKLIQRSNAVDDELNALTEQINELKAAKRRAEQGPFSN